MLQLNAMVQVMLNSVFLLSQTIATAVAQVVARAVASALATVSGGKSTAQTNAEAEANKGPGRAEVTTDSITSTSPSGGGFGSCLVISGADFAGDGVINDGRKDIRGSDEACCRLCAEYSSEVQVYFFHI